MPRATRVVLAPPEPWDDAKLADALRELNVPETPLLPGDAIAGLVVHTVEPESGARSDARTAIEVVPHAQRDEPKCAFEVHVLLDTSASMGEVWDDTFTRLEAARHALHTLLRVAPPVIARMSVGAFARDLRILSITAPVREATRPDARDVRPNGPSRMGGAITATLGRIAPRTRAAILLLTDSPGEPRELSQAAQRAQRLGVPVHVLVLAPETDAELVSLAKTTGGRISRATDTPTLAPLVAALADDAGVPHVWQEPRVPRPGERAFEELVGKEKGPLERLGLRKEKPS